MKLSVALMRNNKEIIHSAEYLHIIIEDRLKLKMKCHLAAYHVRVTQIVIINIFELNVYS